MVLECSYCVSMIGTLICSGCEGAQYCSTECQELHWPHHKNSCKFYLDKLAKKKEMKEMEKAAIDLTVQVSKELSEYMEKNKIPVKKSDDQESNNNNTKEEKVVTEEKPKEKLEQETSQVEVPETDNNNEFTIFEENKSLWDLAVNGVQQGLTTRFPSNISDRHSIITLCKMIEKVPFGYEAKEMRKIAKRLKITVKDFGETWLGILMIGAYRSEYKYIMVENPKKNFAYAIDIHELFRVHAITPLDVSLHASRFKIK